MNKQEPTTMKDLMKEFNDNKKEGYAYFNFERINNSKEISITMDTNLDDSMAVSMLVITILDVEKRVGKQQAKELIERTLIELAKRGFIF